MHEDKATISPRSKAFTVLASEGQAMASTQPDAHCLPPYAVRGVVLHEREELLTQQLLFVSEASYRRREQIELELCDIRRELERLGFQSRT
jgi:hypothetical protein